MSFPDNHYLNADVTPNSDDLELWVVQDHTILGSANIEDVIGTEFDDVIVGNELDNELFGGAGNDRIYGGEGNDTLDGGTNTNHEGGAIDVLFGDEDNDSYVVNAGSQLVEFIEGAGDDSFIFGSGQLGTVIITSNELLGGNVNGDGTGSDRLDFSAMSSRVDLSLSNSVFFDIDVTPDSNDLELAITYNNPTWGSANIENVVGTQFNDVIVGNEFDNVLVGGNGDDTLNGREGADALFGGIGIDTYLVNPSEDYLDDKFIDGDQEIIVEDSNGNSNQFPGISSIIDPSEVEDVVDGTSISIDLTAYVSNPEPEQSLTFLPSSSLPAGANLSPAGIFTWTPTLEQAGEVYSIEFVVTDDHGEIPLHGESRFWIYVDFAIPNQAPVISDQTLPNPIAENSSNGTVVGSVVASDPNANDLLNFTIIGGNNDGIFSIDASGKITVADSSQLDYEDTNSHQLIVQVIDNNAFPLSNTAVVNINVENVPDGEPPQFTSTTLKVRRGLSSAVRLSATDAEDSPEQLSYSLQGIVDAAGAPVYRGYISGGIFSWNGANLGTYTATIEARDTDDNTSSADITIVVSDYNYSSPHISSGISSGGDFARTVEFSYDDQEFRRMGIFGSGRSSWAHIIHAAYSEPGSGTAEFAGHFTQLNIRLPQPSDPQTAASNFNYTVIDGPGSVNSNGIYSQNLEETKGTASRIEILVEDDGAPSDSTIRSTSWVYYVRNYHNGIEEIDCNENVHSSHEDWDSCNEKSYVAPLARDDHFSIAIDESLSGTVYQRAAFNSHLPDDVVYDPPQFTRTSSPQNGTVTSFNAETGEFTYVPISGFRGIDTFRYYVEGRTDELPPTNEFPNRDPDPAVPDRLTSNEAVVTIVVGSEIAAVDIDTMVADEDENQSPGQALTLNSNGQSELFEVSLATWLREDRYENDHPVWLSTNSTNIRVWDSESRTNEIFPLRSGIQGGTQWEYAEAPESVFVEAVQSGQAALTLNMSGAAPDTVLFTTGVYSFDARFYRNGSGAEFDPQKGENEIVWNLDRDEDNKALGPNPIDPLNGAPAVYPILDYMRDDSETHAESLNLADDELVRMDLTVQNWPTNSGAEWKVDFTNDKVRLYYQDPQNDNAITELSSDEWISGSSNGNGLIASVYIEAIDKSTALEDITIDPHVREVGSGITFHEKNLLTSIVGELSVTEVKSAQVLYDVPLVIDKATIASARVNWTSPYSELTDGAWLDDVRVKLLNVSGIGSHDGNAGDIEEQFTIYKFPSANKKFIAIPYASPGVPGEIATEITDQRFRRTVFKTHSELRKQGLDTANVGVFHPKQSQKLSVEIDSANSLLEHEENNNQYTAPNAFEVRQFKHQLYQIDYGFATWGLFDSGDVADFNVPPSKAAADAILDKQFADLIALSPIPRSKVVYNYLGLKQEQSHWQGLGMLNQLDTLGSILDFKYRVGDASVWILPNEDAYISALGGRVDLDGYNPRRVDDNHAVFVSEGAPRQTVAHEFGHDVHGLGHPEGPASTKGWNVERFAAPLSPLWRFSDGFNNGKAARPNDVVLENYMSAAADGNLRWVTREQYLQLLEYYTNPVPTPPSPLLAPVIFATNGGGGDFQQLLQSFSVTALSGPQKQQREGSNAVNQVPVRPSDDANLLTNGQVASYSVDFKDSLTSQAESLTTDLTIAKNIQYDALKEQPLAEKSLASALENHQVNLKELDEAFHLWG